MTLISKNYPKLRLLNVRVSKNRFCIAQKRVEDKSNEITAIPAALDSIDITDAVITSDVRLWQAQNAFSPMEVIPLPIITVVIDLRQDL
jgi:hypothetical protein